MESHPRRGYDKPRLKIAEKEVLTSSDPEFISRPSHKYQKLSKRGTFLVPVYSIFFIDRPSQEVLGHCQVMANRAATLDDEVHTIADLRDVANSKMTKMYRGESLEDQRQVMFSLRLTTCLQIISTKDRWI